MFGWKDGATEELLRCNSVQTIDFRGLESGLELSSVSSDSGLEHYSVSVCYSVCLCDSVCLCVRVEFVRRR